MYNYELQILKNKSFFVFESRKEIEGFEEEIGEDGRQSSTIIINYPCPLLNDDHNHY